MHLMDTWPLVYKPTHQRDSMGRTYPAAEPGRHTDRVSMSNTLQGAVAGVYNTPVGQGDQPAVITQLKLEEDTAGRRTIQPDIIRSDQFRANMQHVFAEHAHL